MGIKQRMQQLKLQKWGTRPEWAVFLCYVVFYVVVTVFHEPWYDEAEAWQIARCASFQDILFYLPHYEGHPPLWHLMLAIPAKLGVPYELGLKSVAGIIAFAVGWLLLFRSPFPRAVRLLLPFNYFVFYQYGIIARPYGLMLLALLLSAITFADRNNKPWRFVACLFLLCLTSAYGIVIAGGIAVVWVVDILLEKQPVANLLKDARTHSLTALLAGALLLVAEIMPYRDTFGISMEHTGSPLPIRLLYTCFGMLADATMTSVIDDDIMLIFMRSFTFDTLSCGVLLGILEIIILYFLQKEGFARYLFAPYFLFTCFGGFVYLTPHHTGIIIGIVLFGLWISGEQGYAPEKWESFMQHFNISFRDAKALRKLTAGILGLALIIPIYWNTTACIHEVGHNYVAGKDIAYFLKDHKLDDARMMTFWFYEMDEEDKKSFGGLKPDIIDCMNTNLVDTMVVILPYLKGNTIQNLNNGREDMAYTIHKDTSREDVEMALAEWGKMPYPDLLLGKPMMKYVYKDIDMSMYVPVYEANPMGVNIWKNFICTEDIYYEYIYLRKDLLEKHGLKQLDVEFYFYPYD